MGQMQEGDGIGAQVQFWGIAVVAAGCWLGWFGYRFEWDAKYTLGGMIDGTAYRPFVGRALVPLVIRAMQAQAEISAWGIMVAVWYGAMIGFLGALRMLAYVFWMPSRRLDMIVLGSLFGMIPLVMGYRTMYDLPTVWLFTLGLAFMAQRQWTWFLVVYSIGCVNRETTALLTLVFLMTWADGWGERRMWTLVAMQAVALVAIRGALAWIFRDNPGHMVDFTLWFQIVIATHMPIESAAHLGLGIAVGLLVAAEVRQKPRFLRRAFVVLVPSLMVMYALFGNPWEIRVFLEGFPTVYLLMWTPRLVGQLRTECELHSVPAA
jgi:hypothetical protein